MNRRKHLLQRISRRVAQARLDPLRWLIILGFPLIVVLGGIVIVSLVFHNASMHTMVAERNAITARAIASLLGQKLDVCLPVSAARPIPRDDVLACWREVNLSELAMPVGGHRLANAFVFDESGMVILHTNPAGLNTNVMTYPGVQEALKGIAGSSSTLFGPENEDRVVAYAPILARGVAGQLGLVLDEPWDEAQDVFTRFSLLIPFIAVGVMALSGLVVTLVMRAQTQTQQLRVYARALTNAQETERNRLARELHDGTVQDLVALHQKTQLLRMDAAQEAPALLSRIEEVRNEARHLIDDVRRTSHGLRPVHLDELGLPAALERMTSEMNEVGKQQPNPCLIGFKNNFKRKRLNKNTEMALYRIAQEAITNAMRYSGATQIAVALGDEDGETHLVVEDNGKGFDTSLVESGMGLISMRERAAFVGGVTIVQSQPGEGTRVDVYV